MPYWCRMCRYCMCQEQEKREKEVESLQESLNDITSQIEALNLAMRNLSLGVQQVSGTDYWTCLISVVNFECGIIIHHVNCLVISVVVLCLVFLSAHIGTVGKINKKVWTFWKLVQEFTNIIYEHNMGTSYIFSADWKCCYKNGFATEVQLSW